MSSQAKLLAVWAALAIASLPWLVACGKSGSSDESAPAVREGMTLYVANHNLLDIRVYLVRDDERRKIGVVPSMVSSVFHISAAELGGAHELRLLADPIGARESFSTAPIPIQPGAIIEWQVEKNLKLSSILLR